MNPLPEFHRISDSLFVWYGYDPGCKCDCASCAIQTESGLTFIDPLPLQDTALEELLKAGQPYAILLTSANHQRAAHELRSRLGVPIIASAEAQAEVDANDFVKNLPADIKIIPLPGAAVGEIAVYHKKTLIVGDSLIHLDGLAFLPDKYCSDPQELRRSAKSLLAFDFETVCFAHGLPLRTNAREKLAALVG